MKCYVHPDVDAVGTCSNCGKFVCTNCAIDYMGKVTCKTCVEKMSAAPAAVSAPSGASAPVGASTSPNSGPTAGAAPYVAPAPAPARKEPILSLILSFFIPGLGQVYNGHVKKGIILVIVYIALWVIMMAIYFAGALVTMGVGALCCIPVFIIPLIVWLYAMYDGYKVANAINRGEPTKDWLS